MLTIQYYVVLHFATQKIYIYIYYYALLDITRCSKYNYINIYVDRYTLLYITIYGALTVLAALLLCIYTYVYIILLKPRP